MEEDARLQRESDSASRQALKILQEVIRWSRDGSPLPQDVMKRAADAAMELSRCGFEEETEPAT